MCYAGPTGPDGASTSTPFPIAHASPTALQEAATESWETPDVPPASWQVRRRRQLRQSRPLGSWPEFWDAVAKGNSNLQWLIFVVILVVMALLLHISARIDEAQVKLSHRPWTRANRG